MTLKTLPTVDGELADAGWKLYTDAFTDLNARAAQRHLMYRSEFDQVMADPRVGKYLTLDDAGVLAGLATFGQDLDAFPLIAPEFFARIWPTKYAERRIFYIGFVAVAPHARGSGAFIEVLADYYRTADAVDGIVCMDICAYNEQYLHLPQVIAAQVRRLSGGVSKSARIDTQSFWAFDMKGNNL